MHLIFLSASLALLWLHLSAAQLLAARVLSLSPALNRALGVLFPVLLLFFLEHFVGLGRLQWLWPLTTLASAATLYLHRQQCSTPAWRRAEITFALCFGWGLLWKVLFPAIYPTSERVTDLYFMANYYDGQTLPPLDHWFAGYRFDFYYSFQHYAAALMGRWFGWDRGFAYNIAFALLLGLGVSLAYDFIRRLLPQRRWSRYLLAAALAFGGTGVTPLLPAIVQNNSTPNIVNAVSENMWASARFIGNYDERVNTEWGRTWFARPNANNLPAPGFEVRELPLENFGYQFYLGDYHPPLGGFFLLFLALALIVQLQPNSESPISPRSAAITQAALAACLPLMLITNTWVFPMLALLLACWLGWRYQQGMAPNWRAFAFGLGSAMLLIYPFFTHFSAHTLSTPIRLVNAIDHTPWASYLLLMWPLLILLLLTALEIRRQPLAGLMFAAFLLMLLVSEFIFVDDPSAGRFERTNTTMKWWGWMWSGGLLACGAIALASSRRWVRYAAQLVLLLLCTYAWNTAQYVAHSGTANVGRLQGKDWFTSDVAVGNTVDFLAQAPRGIVLENWLGDSYTNQTLYALFSGQPSLMGWPHHLGVWHNGQQSIWLMNEEVQHFYRGEMDNPLAWLNQHQVRYIVWGRPESTSPQWQKINNAIRQQYAWRGFMQEDKTQVGVWQRRDSVLPLVAPTSGTQDVESVPE